MNRRFFLGGLLTIPALFEKEQIGLYSDDIIIRAKQFIGILELPDRLLYRFQAAPFRHVDGKIIDDGKQLCNRIERKNGEIVFGFPQVSIESSTYCDGLKIYNHKNQLWNTQQFQNGRVHLDFGDHLNVQYSLSIGAAK